MHDKVTYLIVGASGSGKTYITEKLCKEFGYENTLSRTERKPRYEGEYGHLFVSSSQADKEYNKSVARTVYKGNRYYTLPEDIKDFYIIDVSGVKSMNDLTFNTKVIFLKIPLLTRIKNMRKRGDKWVNIFDRLIYDFKEFKNFKGDLEFRNSDNMYTYFKLITQANKGE